MPPYLLDTNIVSDLMADHPKVVAKAVSFASQITCSVIVRGEIIDGLTRLPVGKRRTGLEAKATQVFAKLSWEPVTVQVADLYGQVKATLIQQGLNINDNDLWIAATALSLGAVLVTRDKHFSHIPGLQIEDWTQ